MLFFPTLDRSGANATPTERLPIGDVIGILDCWHASSVSVGGSAPVAICVGCPQSVLGASRRRELDQVSGLTWKLDPSIVQFGARCAHVAKPV